MSNIDICENLKEIRHRIEKTCQRCGRNPDEVILLAVSKTKPVSAILKAMECGHLLFGENRMKELEEKMTEVSGHDISWHMIGNLQTNKIKYIADRVDYIHSVEKVKHLEEIDKRAGQHERTINVLIQVNISNEKQKGGCRPEELPQILTVAADFSYIRVKGLMGMAELVDNAEEVRPQFKLLKQLFDSHQNYNYGSVDLQHISMGMTNDFEVAIEEGSTMVRIGSAIFGERNYG